MGELFLIILAVALIATGKGSVILWIVGGFLVLAVIAYIAREAKNRKAQEYLSSRSANRSYSKPAVQRMNSVCSVLDEEDEEDVETATLIFHPHYISDNEYECSACGERFGHREYRCPECGARFTDFEKDEEEWEEEFDEECDMDEEDW